MREATRQGLAAQVAEWRHAGLIDGVHEGILQRRWGGGSGGGGVALLKALALFAVFALGASLVSLIGSVLHAASPMLSAIFLLLLAIGVGFGGVRLSTDPASRQPFTGQVLVTFALTAIFVAFLIMAYAMQVGTNRAVFVAVALFTSGAAFFVAYRYALRWPQFLALLLLFHGVGSAHGYMGGGGYFADILDERVMALIAAMGTAFGLWHEQRFEWQQRARHVGFGHLYVIFGLIYLNLSVWFLSLHGGAVVWVTVFTLVCIAQLVIGARLKDARVTGFAIVFLGIDLYTRLFEHFWDALHKGVFFLIAGGIAVAVGIALERRARRQRGEVTP